MSPTRTRRPLSPAWLAMLFLVGCAVESRDGSETPKPELATPAQKPCAACQAAPACPPVPVFYGAAPVPPSPAVAPVVYTVPPAPVAPAVALSGRHPQRPVGTWEREVGTRRITLRFEEERLFGLGTIRDSKSGGSIIVEADYSVTKDNVAYGVISSIELVANDDAQPPIAWFDIPFSVRIRQDGDTLTVKGLKVLQYGYGTPDGDLRDLGVVEGRYKRRPDSKSAH